MISVQSFDAMGNVRTTIDKLPRTIESGKNRYQLTQLGLSAICRTTATMD